MDREFRVILERNELGGFTVTVPALPGCVTQGSTREEALERVKEAILCHLEGLAAEVALIAQDGERDLPAHSAVVPCRQDVPGDLGRGPLGRPSGEGACGS